MTDEEDKIRARRHREKDALLSAAEPFVSSGLEDARQADRDIRAAKRRTRRPGKAWKAKG